MKVTTVSASVRYSKKLDDNGHKTIELSAEANLDAKDRWQDAQVRLYQELGQQLKALWNGKANGNGQAANGSDNGQTEHYCREHGVPFKRHEKGEQVWYAHKAGQKWCWEQRS